MNAFHIKVFAIVTMFIDHIGLFFFPESFLLRTVGRLSFPLFAWLIANGALHTKNINKYFVRLVIFAFLSQIPYMLASRLIDPTSTALNIFFTLSIGLGSIILIRKTTLQIHWVLISLLSAALAFVLNTDYGGFGVLSIISFYLFFKNKRILILTQVIIYILMSIYFLSIGNSLGLIQFIGLASLFIIAAYNYKSGLKWRYLFYAVYPLHYLLIYFVLILT